MKKWWLGGVCAVVIGAMAVLNSGCSDDKGSGSDNLTTEDQYNAITQYFAFDPDNDSAAVDVSAYVLGLLSGQYWDGIDTADISGLAKRVLPNAKRTTNDLDSLYVDYSPTSHWWFIYYSISASGTEGTFEFVLKDSVRYHSSDGNYQIQPDESTDRVDLRQHLTAEANGLSEGLAAHHDDHFELVTGSDSRFTITKLSPDLAQVDGEANVSFDLDAAENDTAAVIGINLGADYDSLAIPIEGWNGEPCPTGGDVTAGLDITVSVETDDESAEAHGSWDASIEFTGSGDATVQVQSGDFSREYNGSVCEPPIE